MSNVKWNLWRSIESALLLQRIFFVSPFELNHWTGRLTSTFFTKMYVISVFTAAAAIVYISLFKWHCVNLIMKLMPSGFLWSLLTGYEIVSINVHFILNTWLSYINKKKQIKFLHTLHSIDGQLLTEFRAKVDFKKHRRWLNIEVALICIYYLTIAVGAARIWYELGHLEMIPLLIVYQFQWVCLCLPIYMSANYLLLIQSRYEVLYKTYRKLQVEYSGYVRACKPNKIISTHFLNKLQKIIEIFKEITNLIDILNNAFGWLFLVSIVKSFAMILIQAYLLVFMLTNGTDSVDKDLSPFVVLYSLSGEFIKVMMNLIALMKIFSAIDKCKHAFRQFDKIGNDRSIKQLCANFELWSSHYKIHYTANYFVELNPPLFFVSSCGIVTYLLILGQFKMQEDEYQAVRSQLRPPKMH